ncbi:MAG TPA: DUF6410 domain-containing protein [Cryptosporangiaceae bacterium]|nr:DUF6410 domain-containing protein [Cryptosporangiaceae bacterium]
MTTQSCHPTRTRFAGGRAIGPWGTLARVVSGVVLAGSVLYGHWTHGWHVEAWVLGLLVFPAVALGWQWWWARRHPAPLRATGPVGHLVNMGVFLALYLTWWYAPALDALSDAALLFYGGSMLLAAARGYAGCEVFALSNMVLRRDDQVGCVPFFPIDAVESWAADRTTDRAGAAATPGAH